MIDEAITHGRLVVVFFYIVEKLFEVVGAAGSWLSFVCLRTAFIVTLSR